MKNIRTLFVLCLFVILISIGCTHYSTIRRPAEENIINAPEISKNEIELFKKKIIEYENLLFGLSLYYQGIIYLYSDYAQIVQMNKKAYDNIMKRGNIAIKEAKKILRKVQENPNEIRLIREFIFPPIYGIERLRILVETYNELFPSRPRNIPLSEGENLKLMKAVVNKLNKSNFLIKEKAQHKKQEKKIPITPFEVIKRMKDIPKILEWSKNKHLTVSGPEFWGIHHIYIDSSLKHVIFCLKPDLISDVFIGIPTGAKEWRKYDKDGNLLFSKQLNDNSLEWKIYKDIVLYKGKMLPPKEIPEEPYWGEIVGIEIFNDYIDDQWIVSKIKELYNK